MTGAIYRQAANVSWRDYWMNKVIPSLPYQTTIWANYAAKIDRINSGLGLSYCYDATGVDKINTTLLSYAYHIPIKSLFLSIGASAGIKIMETGYPNLISPSTNNDPTLLNSRYKPVFSSDFGIAVRNAKWNVGISVTQWNRSVLKIKNSAYSHQLEPYFWLFADYKFNLGAQWSLTPRIQYTTDLITIHPNWQLLATWRGKLWFGLGAENLLMKNSSPMISPMIGYDIKGQFRIGYATTITSNIHHNQTNIVTHSVVLSFLMK